MNDSGHWYDRETGEPRFEIKSSKGTMRRVTLRDAKKHGYLPSPTTILRVLAKPELDKWKQKQVILATLDNSISLNENQDEYCDRIIEAAFKQVDDAADLGTRIHKAIENHFQGIPYDQELKVYIEAVKKWVQSNEVAFISHELRVKGAAYAGTTDGLITCPKYAGAGIIDFKTRKSKQAYPMTPWATEPMQVAAYAYSGTKAKWGVNLYISTVEPGRVEATWYDPNELFNDFKAFELVLNLWIYLNDYKPHLWTAKA